MDNEGFRIPRRFVARDAVVDEMERLDKAIAAAAAEIAHHRETVSAELGEKYGAIFEAHLQMLQDARLRSELEEMIRQRHYSPEYAVSRTLRRYAQVFQRLESSLSGGAGQRHFRHREAAAAAPAGPPPRGDRPPHLAGAGAGPQPHAQRDGQSRPPLRPRLRHRGRRAGQPHGDRGRGPGNSRRGGHRAVPHRGLRRRPGDHRRRQGAGDPPARRGDAGPLPPRGRGDPHPGRPAGAAPRSAGRNRATASASSCWATSSSPTRSTTASIAGPTAWACTAPSSSTSAPRREPTEEVHFQAYSPRGPGDGRQAGGDPHVRPGRRQDAEHGPRRRTSATRAWGCGASAWRCGTCPCSARSCGRSCGPRPWATCRSCSRWSPRCWSCGRRKWCWPT